eukprot:TRINITY_DN49385_c0_g1_i1.p1 TRINITY_DN49385_c0_g1~~TRINITY_DN49385_c0_g1_i1.p1  ORF type:complete len:620 (+),score=130.62 TRINITY_DN49385_c0_g1_i1:89-1948(+)
MTGMLRSRSVPGLMGLGNGQPEPVGFHGKKVTLDFHRSGAVDLQPNFTAPSDKAKVMSEMLKNPSWRWTSVEQEQKNQQEDVLPKNMRCPRLTPAWLKHDKQVLRFYGFFQEGVSERREENSRYRQVVICYFLEDGTLSITEPKIENSGIPQGMVLKRHQVPSPLGGNVGPGDFRVGEDVDIYGVRYHICGTDRFTRWFFEENGVELAEDEPLVQDQWQKSYTFQKVCERGGLPMSRSAVEAKNLTKFQLGQPPADTKLVQFMQNDRKVLRFKAYWDDTTLYGNRIYFKIQYYLADNTMEISEAHARNSGRDAYPTFFKRGPLIKDPKVMAYPGMLEPEKRTYMPEDLLVGQSIDVWRRKVVIYDCDDFTRNFYAEYMHIDQQQNTLDVSDKPKRHTKLLPPPHSGPGTEEDSYQNCTMIQPKAAKQDLQRLMILSGELLRFEARMANGEPEDENRKFIIGWYPADKQVACWELLVRNSGHMGGKFAEKKRRKNPDTGKYFELHEFGVGRTVCIAAQPMHIVRADEHTLQFLERNVEDFPMAAPGYCAEGLRPIMDTPEMRDENGVDPDTLKDLAVRHGIYLIDHELITLLRNFCVSPEEGEPRISGPRIREYLEQLQR